MRTSTPPSPAPNRSRRLIVPPPWDGRLVAIMSAVFLGAYIFIFTDLVTAGTKGAVIGTSVIAAVQVFVCVLVAGFLITRPRNRSYAWVALGLGVFITALSLLTTLAGRDAGITVVVRSPLFFLAIIALALFDTGRVQSWVDRRITFPASAVAVALYIALVLVSPSLPSGTIGLDCGGACQATAMNAVDWPVASNWLAALYLVTRSIALVAAIWGLIHRYRTAGGVFRVMLRPVVFIGVLYMAAGLLATFVGVTNLGGVGDAVVTPLVMLTRIAIPIAIGAGVLLGEQRRGGTLERDFAAIRAAQSPAEVQTHLRSLLDDRALTVVLPGEEFPRPGCEVTELRSQDGRLIATLCHRDGLEADQPVAFNIAIPAATLALEHLELEGQMAEMEARLAEARRQAVTAGDEERHRIEQDLHDGAQLRIILLRGRIERLAGRTSADDAGSHAEVETMLRDADELLAEIRGMSAGMRRVPPGQLHHALTDLAAAAPLHARVSAHDLGEVSADAEQAVFYCISEALQNAAKHAGSRASVLIEVGREGDDIVFAVSDDGVGLAPDHVPGRGLAGMADRVAALGGALEPMTPLPFGGTTVRGRIPAAARARRAHGA